MTLVFSTPFPACLLRTACALFTVLLAWPLQASPLAERSDVQGFVQRMVSQHGFTRQQLVADLNQATIQASILKAISKPVERTYDWQAYRKIFIQTPRIESGADFMRDNAADLQRAQQQYGVPAEIITAILGVETKYGAVMGSHKVLDALVTLAFDYPKRAKFFRKELEHFLLLCREQGIDPAQPLGSYAGAMGYGQFMPSSYRHYAVDFDDDGKVDIWNNKTDAIGSIANYFARHGWRRDGLVTLPAHRNQQALVAQQLNKSLKPTVQAQRLPQLGYQQPQGLSNKAKVALFRFKTDDGPIDLLGLHNFYVITRYNHSRLYAMAVLELSERIASQRAASL